MANEAYFSSEDKILPYCVYKRMYARSINRLVILAMLIKF